MIRVEVYLEQMYADEREKAMEGLFTMVAIDDNKHPVPISFDNNCVTIWCVSDPPDFL